MRRDPVTREPQTEAGRRLNDDYRAGPGSGGIGPYTPDIIAIEIEAWNAALQAVEEAVGGMRAFEHDGAFVCDAREDVPELHYVNRTGVLSRIAALRKPAALNPKEPS
jgi:hypothetical protein